jgi:cytochrome P450/protein-S-isoprenylcysteine O-methyltransferase Ste14
MSRSSLELLIVAGWAAQAVNWMWALARSGRRAATPTEWTPELLLRAGVLTLVVWAVIGPPGSRVPLGDLGALLWGVAFLAGHTVAILGRVRLAGAWGIGTRPKADLDAPVRSGIYRLVSHPIYLGISVALIAQLVLLQNLPALLLVVGAAVVNPWKIARERRLLRRKQAPGPGGGHWLLGHVPAFRRDPLAFMRDAVHTWGDVVAFRAGRQRAYLIWRPEHVQQVLQNDPPGGGYSKNVAPLGPMGDVLGRGLVTSTGEEWRRQRQIVQPAFHPRAGAMQSLAATVTSAVTEMMAQWRPGAVVDVHGEMMRLAFLVVGETLFGADLREHAVVVRRALEEIQRQSNQRIDALVSLPLWVPTRRNRAFRQAVATLHGVVSNVIARPGGLGSLLTELRGSMDERLLHDQIVTLLLAGHENSGNALTWMWYLVARHPAVAERLTAELEDVLEGRVPTLDDLPHLPYTRMVAEETLRLYPPGWVTLRRAEEPDEIGGFAIERGAIIVISSYLTHRHPQHWPDPDVFDPERFAESRSAARHRFAYLAFGGGSRRCVGGGFAIAEMQLVLATVAQRFSFELATEAPPLAPLPVVSLPPRDGLRMRVGDSSLIRR